MLTGQIPVTGSVTGAGKRIAVITPLSTPQTPKADHEVVFLQNFFDELRRRAPLH
jgi:hypothetical protein